jgi:LysR family hydrogen peroxide-inducible transcriptional activator
VEIHQLRYFVSVVEVGSFTRAAQACFVAQPSLSQQIRKLEEELGQPLFERLGRRVRLTSAGHILYERAARILSSLAEARDALRDPSDLHEGEIQVAAIPTVAPYFLPPLLRTFTRKFRRAEVTVHEDFTAEIVRGCAAGDVDLGIVALPIEDARLAVEPLFSEDLLVSIPATHPLARKRRITLEELTQERFVLLSEIHCLGAQVVRFCERRGCTPAVTCRSAQLLTVQELVGLGQGVSLVPKMAARTDRSNKIIYRMLEAPRPSRTLAMIWHKHRYQSPLVIGLIETIRAEGNRKMSKWPRRNVQFSKSQDSTPAARARRVSAPSSTGQIHRS